MKLRNAQSLQKELCASSSGAKRACCDFQSKRKTERKCKRKGQIKDIRQQDNRRHQSMAKKALDIQKKTEQNNKYE